MPDNPRTKPPCEGLIVWLRNNLGTSALGALTGTDRRCLQAAVHVIEAYSYGADHQLIEDAFSILVTKMQPGTRYFAYHAIAYVMDWNDRALIWRIAGLEPLATIPMCKGGPR
jgi:hypothetical protein